MDHWAWNCGTMSAGEKRDGATFLLTKREREGPWWPSIDRTTAGWVTRSRWCSKNERLFSFCFLNTASASFSFHSSTYSHSFIYSFTHSLTHPLAHSIARRSTALNFLPTKRAVPENNVTPSLSHGHDHNSQRPNTLPPRFNYSLHR